MTAYVNGFCIGDDGRVSIEDSAPASFWQGLPFSATGSNAGEQAGPVAQVSAKSAFDAAGEIVYQDVSVTPYSGKQFYSAGLPHTADGKLLMNSADPISFYNGGIPYTADGCIACAATTPPPPPADPYILAEDGSPLLTENGENLIV